MHPLTQSRRWKGGLLLGTAFAIAASAAPMHVVAADSSAVPSTNSAYLSLAPGNHKWPTDEPLRTSMAAMRQAYDEVGPNIENFSAAPPDMIHLGDHIQQYVNAIITQSHLPTEAQPNLDYLIADLQHAAALLHGTDPKGTPYDGASVIKTAFNAYGQYFDDPNWSAK
jgi:hypothetical protein